MAVHCTVIVRRRTQMAKKMLRGGEDRSLCCCDQM